MINCTCIYKYNAVIELFIKFLVVRRLDNHLCVELPAAKIHLLLLSYCLS